MELLDPEKLNGLKRFIPGRLTDILSWHGHLPFAFWIMEAQQPDLFVELGTHKGDSYCAFCQAVEQLKINCRCNAVDIWQGDEHSGYYGNEVFEELKAYNADHFGDFSELLRMKFDDALIQFSDNSIDLLHIDGHHTYEAVRHDFTSWLPKLSRHGVVLIHDTCVYRGDFGVWKFVEEIRGKYPVFDFLHSNGLIVVGTGDDLKEEMKALFDLPLGRADEIRSEFKRLGTRLRRLYSDAGISVKTQDTIAASIEKNEIDLRKIKTKFNAEAINKASLGAAPVISVIMPAFNHQEFILKSVESVLAQTFPDFELIIIDDGSEDNTLQMLSKVDDERVTVYSQRNQGAAATINRGLTSARGKYLAILNSDDIYHVERLEKFYRILDQNKDIDMLASLLTPVDRNGNEVVGDGRYVEWLEWYHEALQAADDDRMPLPSLLIRNYIVTTSNFFFRREVFERNRPFNNKLRYCHDYEYLIRIFQKHPFHLVREFLLKYRLHETNTINEAPFARSLETLYTVFNTIDSNNFLPLPYGKERIDNPILVALLKNPLINHEIITDDLKAALDQANSGITEKNRQLEETKKGVAGLQEHIQKYDKKLKETNAHAVELQGVVKSLNARLIELNEQLRAKGRELGEIHQRLSEAMGQITVHEAKISTQEVLIDQKNQLLDQKNQMLHEIFTSKGWIWLMRLRRIKQILDIRTRFYREGELDTKIPYRVKLQKANFSRRPKIVHVIANMLTGGSSRLVVDLIEHLGHIYDQEVITSMLPSPPAYSGFPCQQIVHPKSLEDLAALLKSKNTALLHIHYWGECDEPWYRYFFEAARSLSCSLIENINTPVAPFRDSRVDWYVYVSRFAMGFEPPVPENASVIYPGSDFTLFSRDEAPIPDDTIGMVYRLEPDKLREDAIDVFIEVVKRRPSTRCYIIGGGMFLSVYQARVESAGVAGNFIFTGYVPYRDLPEYYKKMSVFVAPVWKESFGQVSPFAMSMEIPVAGYHVGALAEILGDDAFLGKSTIELAGILCDLLDNRSKRIALGHVNKRRALEHFSIESMIVAYEELYKRILTQAR